MLERSGADCLLICANTLHKLFDDVQAAIKIPVIHIADATFHSHPESHTPYFDYHWHR